jgi:hypothetical protein
MDDAITEQNDPVLRMRGVGKEIWADTDPDEYVRDLRSNWCSAERGEDGGQSSEDGPTRP